MRWCRVLTQGRERFARIDGDEVVLVDGPPWAAPCVTGERLPLASAELLPPVLPPTFYAVGLNYAAHVRHAIERGMAGAKLPERPEVGYRANSALVAHGAEVVQPAGFTGRLEAEGELVAVLGAPLRRCSRDEAADAVFGWTIGNDVSAREWQHEDRTLWRAKNSDSFKPMGPWIETEADPLASTTIVDVDGVPAASFPTGDMIFDPYDYLCEISRYITLVPGDVLWMGADEVVAMQAGHTLGVTITGIGTLRNPVVNEPHLQEER